MFFSKKNSVQNKIIPFLLESMGKINVMYQICYIELCVAFNTNWMGICDEIHTKWKQHVLSVQLYFCLLVKSFSCYFSFKIFLSVPFLLELVVEIVRFSSHIYGVIEYQNELKTMMTYEMCFTYYWEICALFTTFSYA